MNLKIFRTEAEIVKAEKLASRRRKTNKTSKH